MRKGKRQCVGCNELFYSSSFPLCASGASRVQRCSDCRDKVQMGKVEISKKAKVNAHLRDKPIDFNIVMALLPPRENNGSTSVKLGDGIIKKKSIVRPSLDMPSGKALAGKLGKL